VADCYVFEMHFSFYDEKYGEAYVQSCKNRKMRPCSIFSIITAYFSKTVIFQGRRYLYIFNDTMQEIIIDSGYRPGIVD
jgi:hypothetical protein